VCSGQAKHVSNPLEEKDPKPHMPEKPVIIRSYLPGTSQNYLDSKAKVKINNRHYNKNLFSTPFRQLEG